jgi:uncharacterized protein (DUF362 family)
MYGVSSGLGAVWPLSPDVLDGFLLSRVSEDRPQLLDSRHPWAVDALLDGLAEFLRANAGSGHVLVKCSTTTRRPLSHEVSGDLLERVLRVVTDVCAPGSVVMGDGPVWDIPFEEECERQGWAAMARRMGVALRDLNRDQSVEIEPGWPVSKTFLEARAVVSLTKAKTHRRFGVSLAEKTLLGVLSGGRLGHPKMSASGHRVVPWLLDTLSAAAPPIFSIIDGVNGIEGNGPMAGVPSSSHFLCFGPGCLGPEVRGIVEMGFDPALVPSLQRPIPVSKPAQVRWADLRVTGLDFEPAPSCPWLYRSLDRRWGRRRRFATLQQAVRANWPVPEPA